MKTLPLLALATLLASPLAFADGKLEFQTTDTPKSILAKQVGQKIELRLRSGQQLGGKVEQVGDKALHLSAVTGQELFDAVVALDDISAVLVRTSAK